MPKTMKLLLTESVESLGIVGDVVTVRSGYARNYLLPRGFVTEPSEDKIKALAERRAEAERQMAMLRQEKEKLTERLEGVEIELVRACNDLGMLYGSVTQQDIADALTKAGYGVKPRDVRITQAIKRVDHYDITIRLASDLESSIKVHVKSDRPLERDLRAAEDAAKHAAAEEAAKAKAGAVEGGAAPGSADEGESDKPARKPRKAKAEA